MLDKKFFEQLKKEYDSYDVNRRIIIKHSNDILKFAKMAIFALHRDNIAEAEKCFEEADKLFKYLATKIKLEKGLDFEGSYLAAMEEYVEAKLLYQYLKTGKITALKGLKIPRQHHKEIILADFKGRGLSRCESAEDFDAALQKYGVKLD